MTQPARPSLADPANEVIDGVEYVRVRVSEWEALQREAATLRAENSLLRERGAVLEEANALLSVQGKAIQEKLGLNSGNSSLPPSYAYGPPGQFVPDVRQTDGLALSDTEIGRHGDLAPSPGHSSTAVVDRVHPLVSARPLWRSGKLSI